MRRSSRLAMRDFVVRYLNPFQRLRILDVGALDVNGSYRRLFCPGPGPERCWVYQGLDLAAGPNVDLIAADPYAWNVPDHQFDVVVSGQCLQHVADPYCWMDQVALAAKPGGLICIIAPSAGPEHRFPVDCWRVLPDGMRALALFAGFEVQECELIRYPWWSRLFGDCSRQWRDVRLIARMPSAMAGGGDAGPKAA